MTVISLSGVTLLTMMITSDAQNNQKQPMMINNVTNCMPKWSKKRYARSAGKSVGKEKDDATVCGVN